MISDDQEGFAPVYIALGKAINRWGLVEHVLARCYAVCLGGDKDAGRTKFWKVKGGCAGRKIATDELVRPKVDGDSVLLPGWERLSGRLIPLAKRRHELAHGSVGIWHGRPAIAPFFFEETFDTYPPPLVLHVEQIKATVDEYSEMAANLMAFVQALESMPPTASF